MHPTTEVVKTVTFFPMPKILLLMRRNKCCFYAQTHVGYIASTFPRCTTLRLPSGIRNIATKTNKSNSCVLSAGHVYAVAGTIILNR